MAKPRGESTTLAAIDRALSAVPEGTDRHRALSAARQFKASWVTLGEALVEISQERTYRQWGYPQFSAYCQRELHIRQETAQKVVRSFAFLRKHAPDSVSGNDQQPAPSLDMVDLLRKAHGQTRVDPEAWAAVQRDALSAADGPVTRSQLRGRLQSAFPETFGQPAAADAAGAAEPAHASPAAPPPRASERVDPGHARKVLLLAERLHALLAEQPSLADEAERDAILALANSLRKHARLPEARHIAGQQMAGKLYSEGELH